jgi:lipopolysaccharide/colanic/teichoic acid biosynthesis glycosyltransferase
MLNFSSRAARLCSRRLLDVTFALVIGFLLTPVALTISAVVALTMGRPVLFKQLRPGLNEQPFLILKFRTMTDAMSKEGTQLSDSERLTRIGRFLRSTGLDEIPQIVNILRGQMSFIGPRPLLMRYLPYFTVRERLRFTMRPGLAGWAQVSGRNQLGWDERLACDVWYVEHWSFALDWKVTRMTMGTIIKRKGFSDDPESLMENLDVERKNQVKRSDVE